MRRTDRSKGTILSFYDYTSNIVKPWADAGYDCRCYDLLHPDFLIDGNIAKVRMDILLWQPQPYYKVKACFFAPPCTDIAVSGARWFKEKGLDGLIHALRLFAMCIKIADYYHVPYMIENPVSTVSSYYRKPDHTFQPWEYGDGYTKKTCLWTGCGFKMPEPVIKKKPGNTDDRIHKLPPSPNRGQLRSATPMGFAKAVYRANK